MVPGGKMLGDIIGSYINIVVVGGVQHGERQCKLQGCY